ncbi:hypothetical protein AZI86_14895 [Bdellovibrio bacteriovorus]|uniref:Uncharacterized protein n=1 Tax=Bdellovibrio bacteriovorus TaxID=959 RepID=A0A150WK45_BDEBC|nr:hypothetical protein [Bdellovibrio bacteriovorus]KYG64086.1 hypothetical protein AZI86_14895 [Bdellovibrio bacteriovorus]
MKWFFVLSFVLTTSVASLSAAAPSFSGELSLFQESLHITLAKGQCPRYQLVPKNSIVALHMRKLASGDFVEGSGQLDDDHCKAFVESIEYVGLRKLLGYWYSETAGIITVRDFSSLSFYPMNKTSDLKDDALSRTGDPITYRYSVTPSEGKEWVVFLSNAQGTSFATLMFSSKFVTMKIYDSETGSLNQTLRLSKWGDLKR